MPDPAETGDPGQPGMRKWRGRPSEVRQLCKGSIEVIDDMTVILCRRVFLNNVAFGQCKPGDPSLIADGELLEEDLVRVDAEVVVELGNPPTHERTSHARDDALVEQDELLVALCVNLDFADQCGDLVDVLFGDPDGFDLERASNKFSKFHDDSFVVCW